jgi:teichuronic acid biosynthesis glycosyltransferase TuaC
VGFGAERRPRGGVIQPLFRVTRVGVVQTPLDAGLFHPKDKVESRRLLGLDKFAGKKLVGVCGGLNAFHGANIVFNAFPGIAARDPGVVFVVAGKVYDECPLPEREDVAYLGMLPHTQMPYFFSAMDVQVVALSNTRFGYYAFPQKAYEVLACAVPVAAADVGAVSLLFEDLAEALYDPDSSGSLADTVIHQLNAQSLLNVDIPTWNDQADKLGEFIVGS